MDKQTFFVGGVILVLLLSGCLHRGRPETMAVGTTASITSTTMVPTGMNLSEVKVAIIYERISDGELFGRSMDEVVDIVEETDADLVFRAFFRWQPVPQSPDSELPGYPANYVKQYTKRGYSYEQCNLAIREIKAKKPDVLIVGAIAAQRLNRIEFDDLTYESFDETQTWDMAFDPKKSNLSGILGSKEDIQCKAAKMLGWISSGVRCPSEYDPGTVSAYFPDITDERYQQLLLSYAKKQIDLGADGIWIDMLFSQPSLIYEATNDPDDPKFKASYDAASEIVDRIHEYGRTKYDKYIYVGTEHNFVELPYGRHPAIDFVTPSPKSSEILGGFNDTRWSLIKSNVAEKLGDDVIILVNTDWGGSEGGIGAPLTVYTQKLSPEQQREYLKTADAYFTKRGMVLIYPVHGGTFPTSSARLSFGKYNIHDCLAPEFQTYGMIKELAQNKSK